MSPMDSAFRECRIEAKQNQTELTPDSYNLLKLQVVSE